MRDRYFPTPGGDLHYLEWPAAGPQAHFLHGNGLCAGTYRPFLSILADRLHLFAGDVRGHGDSAPVPAQHVFSWRPFAEDLRRVVRDRMAPPVIGIGHSLGAVLTAMAAASHPGLFSKLVLVDPVFPPAPVLWLSGMARLLGLSRFHPLARGARRRRRRFSSRAEALERFRSGRGIFRTWSPPFIEAYLACALTDERPEGAALKCEPETEARFFESVPLDTWRFVGKIRTPTLVLRGARSDVFTPEAAERVRRAVPGCEVVTVPETSHFIPMEAPRRCAGIILDFIEGAG